MSDLTTPRIDVPNNTPNADTSLSPNNGSPINSTIMIPPQSTDHYVMTTDEQNKLNTSRAIATEKQVEIVLAAIKNKLHGQSISKEALPGVLAACMLALIKLKYNTPEQNRRVALEGISRYLDTLQLDLITKKELYADADTASDAAMYLYGEIQSSPKPCCIIV